MSSSDINGSGDGERVFLVMRDFVGCSLEVDDVVVGLIVVDALLEVAGFVKGDGVGWGLDTTAGIVGGFVDVVVALAGTDC